jgi:alpha-tubulin suppressor-like RCC1 family protein
MGNVVSLKKVDLMHGSDYYVLRCDNSLWTWCDRRTGDSWEETELTMLMDDVKDFLLVGYEGSPIMVIKNDGTLWGVGVNTAGELGDGTKITRDTFIKLADDVKSISSYVILKNDGSYYRWGSTAPTPQLVMSNVTTFSDVSGTVYLYMNDGSVYSYSSAFGIEWGYEPLFVYDDIKFPIQTS